MSAQKEIVFGVDIGATNTALGAVDSGGSILFEEVFETYPERPADEFADRLGRTINRILAGPLHEYTLRGIGIASPAANYLNGTIESPANLRWGVVNFVDLMGGIIDVPIRLVNDGNAAALGERRYGAARGMNNFIELTLGTGMGAGIFVDGTLLVGAHGHGGELGHIVVSPGGRQCGCGRTGCIETYVSASGLQRTIAELLSHRADQSELRRLGHGEISSERIFNLAKQGDSIAIEGFSVTGLHLGRFVANLAATFDPEAVILFGGLSNAGEFLLKPTLQSYNDSVLGTYKNRVKILQSKLNNGRAAVLGASSLLVDSAEEVYQGNSQIS